MRIRIESTTKIVEINGVQTRIWEGQSESGIPVHCYVALIAVPAGADSAEFDAELQQQRVPSPDVAAIPLRQIL